MVSALISRVLLLTAGTLYPAYRSYKGIKTKNVREYVKWMMYWIVFAVYLCLEALADIFVAFWCPLYYELKILFILWLLSPYTKGASLLYRKFLHPFLLKHEQEIDVCLEQFKRESYTRMVDLGNRGLIYAKEAVAIAALRSHEHIVGHIRKTVSLNDVSDSRPRDQIALQYTSSGAPISDEILEEDMEGGEDLVSAGLPMGVGKAGAGRRRVKPARVRPGIGHVIKRAAKSEVMVDPGADYTDNSSDLPFEESSYVIDNEFSYLEEHDETEPNEALEEEDEEDDEASVPVQSSTKRVRKGAQDEQLLRHNVANVRRPKNASDSRYATLPRRSQRKGLKKD